MIRKIIAKGFLVFLVLLLINPITISAGAPDLRYIENPDLKGEVIEFDPPKKKPPNATAPALIGYVASEIARTTETGQKTEEYIKQNINDFDQYMYEVTQDMITNGSQTVNSISAHLSDFSNQFTTHINNDYQKLLDLFTFSSFNNNQVNYEKVGSVNISDTTMSINLTDPYRLESYQPSNGAIIRTNIDRIVLYKNIYGNMYTQSLNSGRPSFEFDVQKVNISNPLAAISTLNRTIMNDLDLRVRLIIGSNFNDPDVDPGHFIVNDRIDLNQTGINTFPTNSSIEQSETVPDLVQIDDQKYWRTTLPNPEYDQTEPISPNNPEHIPQLVPAYVPIGEPVPEPLPQYVPNPNYDPDFNPDTNPDPEPNAQPVYIPNPNFNPDSPPSAENPTYVPNPNYVPEVTPIPEGDPTAVPDFDPITGIGTPPMPDVSIEPLIGFAGMTEKFPFSIPWDIYRIFNYFNVQPQAPLYEVDIPEFINIGDKSIPMRFDINFSVFEPIAAVIRWGLIIAFDISLILMLRRITPD